MVNLTFDQFNIWSTPHLINFTLINSTFHQTYLGVWSTQHSINSVLTTVTAAAILSLHVFDCFQNALKCFFLNVLIRKRGSSPKKSQDCNASFPSIIRNIKNPISPLKDISGAFFDGIGTQTRDLDFQHLRVTLLTTQHISPFVSGLTRTNSHWPLKSHQSRAAAIARVVGKAEPDVLPLRASSQSLAMKLFQPA